MSVSEILAESGTGPEWKVKSLVARGNVTDLSGEAKFSGKTTFTMHMISCILEGKNFMSLPTIQSKVLYLTEQGNNFAEALRKADVLEANGKLFVVEHRDVRSLSWNEIIVGAVEECKKLGVEVLVVEPLLLSAGS